MITSRFYGIIAGVLVLMSILYGVYRHGYMTADREWNVKVLEAEKKYNEAVVEVQKELYATEKAWLEEEAKKEVIYRDKIKTVTKTVTEYIKDNDLSNCRIGTSGMQQLNEAIRSTEGKDK